MYPQSVLSKNEKKYQNFSAENFQFLKLKILCLLHGHVFVMELNRIDIPGNVTDDGHQPNGRRYCEMREQNTETEETEAYKDRSG